MTWRYPGDHTIACWVQFHRSDGTRDPAFKLSHVQKVRTEAQSLDEAFKATRPQEYTSLRLAMLEQEINLSGGVMKDQSMVGMPYVSTDGLNPRSTNMQSDRDTFTLQHSELYPLNIHLGV